MLFAFIEHVQLIKSTLANKTAVAVLFSNLVFTTYRRNSFAEISKFHFQKKKLKLIIRFGRKLLVSAGFAERKKPFTAVKLLVTPTHKVSVDCMRIFADRGQFALLGYRIPDNSNYGKFKNLLDMPVSWRICIGVTLTHRAITFRTVYSSVLN